MLVPIAIVAAFVLVAVLAVLYGADSRELEQHQTGWPFTPRPPQF